MGSYLEIKYLEELQQQYASVEFDSEQPEPHIYVGTEDLLALMKELQKILFGPLTVWPILPL